MRPIVSVVAALTLAAFLIVPHVAAAQALAAAYSPGWKFKTYRMLTDVAADGGTTTHIEMAYEIQSESALKEFNEQTISYHEHDGTLDDIVAYTLKPDGTHIDVPEGNVQVTAHSGVNGTPPAFSDFMERRLIYPQLDVGDTVYLAYTLRNVRPTFKNHFSLIESFRDTAIYDGAEIVVSAPTALGLKQKTYGLAAPTTKKLDHAREQWTWHYANAVARDTRKEQSLFDRAWKYGDTPTILIGNFRDYGQIAAAYEAEAAPRAAPTERIRKLASEIAGDAQTPRERAERTYRWVAKEIAFAGNCLTGGDVVPRDTDTILNLKMGDCKDHATLLQALLTAQDIASTQVLVNTHPIGHDVPELPCWQAFNHVFNYLPQFDLYADATSSYNPFGTLPDQDRGKAVIHTAAFDHVRRTPLPAYSQQFSKATQTITVLADGSIDVDAQYRTGGDLAHAMSKSYRDWRQSPGYDGGNDYVRRSLERMGYHGSGTYTATEGSDGPSDAFAYTVKYHIDRYYDVEDPHGIALAGLFPSPAPIGQLVSYAAAEPYTHDFYCAGDLREEHLTLKLPDNVQLLAVPRDVHAATATLQFDATYRRDGNTIEVERSIADRAPGPVCTPDVAQQYAKIGAAVKKDGNAQAVYEPR